MPDITHEFVSAQADTADPTQIQPSAFNARHVVNLTFRIKSTDYTVDADASNDSLGFPILDDVIKGTGGSGDGITITLPTAVGTNRELTIRKMDSGAGPVMLATVGGQTIDGNSGWELDNQNQSVTIYSDNANWLVKCQN